MEHYFRHIRRAAEQGAGQPVGGAPEVGVVKDVEELGTETKPSLSVANCR